MYNIQIQLKKNSKEQTTSKAFIIPTILYHKYDHKLQWVFIEKEYSIKASKRQDNESKSRHTNSA